MGFLSPTIISSSQSLDPGFDIDFIDASGGNLTITLPDIGNADGQYFILVRTDQTVNTVTVQGFNSSQTINGSVSNTIDANSGAFNVVSLNNVWIQY